MTSRLLRFLDSPASVTFLKWIERVLFLVAIILFFINWKIALIVLLISIFMNAFPHGPHLFFKTLVGCLIIGGGIYLFIDWRIATALIVAGLLITKFYGWVNQKNIEYYGEIRGK